MTACHCPNECPDCGWRHPVASIVHDHWVKEHHHDCQEDQK